MTIILRAVLEDDLPFLHRLTSEPDSTGEKAGFTQEGVLRGAGFRAGRWHDGVLYSMIRADLDPVT